MRKVTILLSLICVMAAFTCTAALAEDEVGIRVLTQESYITLTPQTAAGGEITAVDGDYPNAERVEVVVSGTEAEKQILLLTQTDQETPTESNIIYIDQGKSSSAGAMSFVIFPKSMEAGTTYYVFLASNAESGTVTDLALAATFEYYYKEDPVMVGDADLNGTVDALDALDILRHVAGQIDLSELIRAADVDANETIDALDALDVLRYVAGQITEFTRK